MATANTFLPPLTATAGNLNPHPAPPLSLRSYNASIRSLATSSHLLPALHLFVSMLDSGLSPNEFTFPSVLKSCSLLGLLPLARQLHAQIVKSNLLLSNVFCASALLDLYVKLFPLGDAAQLFDRIPHRNEVTWNTMVSALVQYGYLAKGLEMLDSMGREGLEVGVCSWNAVIAGCVRLGDVELALEFFVKMVSDNSVRPNSASFNTILPIIPEVSSLEMLKELHGFALRNVERAALDSIDEDRLWSAIASAYANCRCMDWALALFERVKVKNSQLGNSMIPGFLNCGQSEKAFELFREMAAHLIHEAQTISKVSLTLLLPECRRAGKTGLEIHAYACRRGLESDTSVSNALMAMYSKRGDKESMEKVFVRALDKDIVSWNTMIANYILGHEFDHAFSLFQRMLSESVRPDEYTLSSVLNGCGHSLLLWQGMALHGHMMKTGFCQHYTVVQNALMDAYGKCGCVEDARRVFDEMDSRDRISWNTVIACYSFSALHQEAFALFDKMTEQGWRPNRITFIALLSACSHAGMLDKGMHYFEAMSRDYGIVPDLDHYACIVDTMGRLGLLDRAYQFIKNMPVKPDDCVWSALLSSCRIHGNVELAEIAAKHLIALEPQHSGYWVLLSNVYADASRWRDVANVRASMKDGGVKKSPGYSWLEVGGSELHRFLTADKTHKQCADIYHALDGLTDQLKDEGYVPIMDSS